MVRNLIAAAVALAVFAGASHAGSYKGKVVKVDAENNAITIMVAPAKKAEKAEAKADKKKRKGEEKTFKVVKDVKIVALKAGKKGEAATEEAVADGLKNTAFGSGGKGGPVVELTTDGEGEKEVVKSIKIAAGKKKKKDQQ